MTTLNPLAVTAEPLLRALKASPTAKNKDLAEASGRKANNIPRDLQALAEAGLIRDRRLTAEGEAQLQALDRAAGRVGAAVSALPPSGAYLQLRHDQVKPDPQNARKDFDEEKLAALADNIFEKGILQAPAVRAEPDANGVRELTMGERRWRAWGRLIADGRWPADHLEWIKLDAGDELARVEAGLVENLQRDDLNHMERGEGFELLAAKYGRSNAEIAKAVGYSPEYVQQHRRLVNLDAASQEALRSEDLSLHDALKILAQPKPEPLTPAELLVLAEWLHRCETHPRKGGYYNGCEVSFRAGADPVMHQLEKKRVVSFTEEFWQDHKAYLEPGYQEREQVLKLKERLKGSPGKVLDELREAAGVHFAERVLAHASDLVLPYATKWLNGPFDLSSKAQKARDDAQAQKLKEKEKTKAQKAQREKRLTALRALDADLRHACAKPIDPRLPTLVAASEIALPVQLKNGRIFDAKGNAVADCNWRFGDRGEAVNLLLATLINAATGYGAAVAAGAEAGPDYSDAGSLDNETPLERRAFERAVAGRLRAQLPLPSDDCLARYATLAVNHLLEEESIDYGGGNMGWTAFDAAYLADAWCENQDAKAAAEEAAEDTDPLGGDPPKPPDRPTFVSWIADRLQELRPEWKRERCQAQAGHALNDDLKRNDAEFGDDNFEWDRSAAEDIAEAWDANYDDDDDHPQTVEAEAESAEA